MLIPFPLKESEEQDMDDYTKEFYDELYEIEKLVQKDFFIDEVDTAMEQIDEAITMLKKARNEIVEAMKMIGIEEE